MLHASKACPERMRCTLTTESADKTKIPLPGRSEAFSAPTDSNAAERPGQGTTLKPAMKIYYLKGEKHENITRQIYHRC